MPKRGRPRKTEAEKEATRKAAVARRREQRRAAAAAKKEGKEPPKNARPKKKPKPKKQLEGQANEPKASGSGTESETVEFNQMDPRGKRAHLRKLLGVDGLTAIEAADACNCSLTVLARWYREATGQELELPKKRRDSAAEIRELEKHKLDQLRRSREIRKLSTSIGELPPVRYPSIKRLCRFDLQLFEQWFFPNSTGLGPFGPPQIGIIDRFELACFHPYRFQALLSRGFVKTTISVHALIWAALYGHSLSSVFLGANDELASGACGSIKRELTFNERLHECFPEVTVPIRALDGKPQRCLGQSYQGRLTMPEWTSDTIVMPTIPGSAASGCIIQTKGLEAAARGLSYKRTDGRNIRPQVIVIDDPQTEKTSTSVPATKKRLDIIRKGVSRLGGHGSKASIILNGTPLKQNDLVEQLADRSKHPGWTTVRAPMLTRMPDREALERHWLGPYAEILTTYDDEQLDGQISAERAAADYYREHREEMDEGFEVAWPSIPLESTEISAIEHAMRIAILEGWDVFMAECQLSPLKDIVPGRMEIAEGIGERTSGYAAGCIPKDAHHLVFGVDVHDEILYWVVSAVRSDFTGFVVDYGTFPEQSRAFFTHATVRETLQKHLNEPGPEKAIELGVEDLVHDLLSRPWANENGEELGVSCGLVDVGYRSTEVANALRRLLPRSAKVLMSRGIGIGPTKKPMAEYDLSPKRVIKYGPEPTNPRWYLPVDGREGELYRVNFDSNFWKDTLAARLSQETGAGCWELFGGRGEVDHDMFEHHLRCEKQTKLSTDTRTVNVWAPDSHRENHYFDCSVLCCLAASLSGAQLPTAPVSARKTPQQSVASPAVIESESGDFSFFATARI
ncbi:MAG TPA: hypothetical protein DDW52_30380 [Planctomycetaceae bacterium]|nr:hypothetical protein [Planctomycetaceae bacterium]